jgi:glycosyltransferase involved in cell wall biosynthesis
MLISNLRGDGAVGMLLSLAEELSNRNYIIDLLIVREDGERAEYLPANVRQIKLGASRPLRAVPAIARYLRQVRPSVLIASEHYTGLPALYALFLARVNTRCVIRQDNTWGMDSRRFRGRHRFLTPWMVDLCFRYAEIIAVSKGVARDLIGHFPHLRKNVTVIYNPVISERLTARAREPLSHPWFGPGKPPVLVAAGRLQPAKGFDVLIDAFSRVVKVTPARLLILGEGPDRELLQQQIMANNLTDACELVGYQHNPYPYMARSHAFVLSSRFEGLPTVLIEALAVGATVIATDCHSGPREILADGAFGTLVPVEDVNALADAMVAQIMNPRAIRADLGEWLRQFDVDTSVDKHEKLIQATLASPPPRARPIPLSIDCNTQDRH